MSQPPGILYVIDELQQLGGAERNLLRILRYLPRDRFRPFLLTFRFNPEVEAFRNLPCPLEIYPVHNLYGWNSFRYAPKLWKLIRNQKIRILHTFFETADLWAGGIAKAGTQAALISGRRDLGIQRNWRLNLIYRFAGGMFDQVQAVSSSVRDYVIQADGMDPARVLTVPNAMELDLDAHRGVSRSSWGLPEDRPLIVTLSNLRRIKGIDVLVRTAARVVQTHPQALFVVAGRILDEEYYREVQHLAQELKVADHIRFIGQIQNPLSLLAASDIFFLPSRSEGMSNALLEAMASSLPAVATDVGGNSQLIEDNETGFLVPSEDAEAAAGRMIRLLDLPEKARRMGAAARRTVEERYSVETMMRLLVREYEALLAHGSGTESQTS